MAAQENRYIIQNVGAETSRLQVQETLLNHIMGEALPPNAAPIHQVLDIASGAGGWAIELGFDHPEIAVVGIDINPAMVEYAQAQAQVQQLENVTFRVMDARFLDFPAEHFDFIHARLLFGFMSPADWPKLWQTTMRLLRPGGWVRWTEYETSATSSAACNELARLVAQGLHRAGQSFSPDGSFLGTTPMMPKLLREAGYQSVYHEAFAIEGTYGMPFFEVGRENTIMALKLIQPFLLAQGIASQDTLDHLYEQAIHDMNDPNFFSMQFLLSVWGQKPGR